MAEIAGIAAAIATVIPLIARIVRQRSTARQRIHEELAIWERLPDGATRQSLIGHVEERIDSLLRAEREPSRDWFGFWVSLVSACGAVVAVYGAVTTTDLVRTGFILLALLAGAFGGGGMVESLSLAKRDERGRRLDRLS